MFVNNEDTLKSTKDRIMCYNNKPKLRLFVLGLRRDISPKFSQGHIKTNALFPFTALDVSFYSSCEFGEKYKASRSAV